MFTQAFLTFTSHDAQELLGRREDMQNCFVTTHFESFKHTVVEAAALFGWLPRRSFFEAAQERKLPVHSRFPMELDTS